MRLELWKQVVLSLSVPLMIAAAVVVYALINLNTLSNRIAHIEVADDIHFAILDLQRYEKNLLLLAEEEESVRRFREAIGTIRRKIHDIESELLREINLANYERLLDFIKRYHEQADLLVEAIKAEQELIERIRPLGRALERRSGQSYMALEMRRHEKNFLIYGEPTAVVSLRATAERLLSRQPDLSAPVGSYLQTFDEIVSRRATKEQTVAQLRNHGQSIQEITKEFSNKERQEIDSTLVFAKKLLVASFLLLVLTVVIVSNRFSENVVRTLRTVEDSLTKRVSLGDFSHGVSVQRDLAPREIVSFVETYNQAVEALGESREELEKTMTRLGQVNRELLDKQEELVENRKLSALRLLAAEGCSRSEQPSLVPDDRAPSLRRGSAAPPPQEGRTRQRIARCRKMQDDCGEARGIRSPGPPERRRNSGG